MRIVMVSGSRNREGRTARSLQAIGKGAAATKYNILASLANWPIIYLTKIDGWARTWQAPAWIPWRGSTLMMLAEALVPIAGTCVFVLIALATRRFFPARAAPAAT